MMPLKHIVTLPDLIRNRNSLRNQTEKSMRFAYEKIRSFSTYKGLRDFKDKFGPDWKNSYIIYDHHYDLFNIPSILSKVVKA